MAVGWIGTAEAWVRDVAYYDFYYEHFSDFSTGTYENTYTANKISCVDMESAAVAARAEAYGIKWLVVRCISDNDRYKPRLNGMAEIGPATTAAAARANAVLVRLMLKILRDEKA